MTVLTYTVLALCALFAGALVTAVVGAISRIAEAASKAAEAYAVFVEHVAKIEWAQLHMEHQPRDWQCECDMCQHKWVATVQDGEIIECPNCHHVQNVEAW